MERVITFLCDGWKLCFEENRICKNYADDINTIEKIERSGFTTIDATIPGNFELDLIKAGIINEDPFFGTNIYKLRDYENRHVWYFTRFDGSELTDQEFIRFEGIDTVADVFLNGELVLSADNMFMSYDIQLKNRLKDENELVVHFKPVHIYARQFDAPVSSHAMEYMYDSLYVRKAAHMYGWDIMPRALSCGLWKDVKIIKRSNNDNYIKDAYVFTLEMWECNNTARLCAYLSLNLSEDDLRDYRVEVEGCCKDSHFFAKSDVWHTNFNVRFFVEENLKLWWPKGSGEPNLYDVEIRLYLKDELCDTYNLKTGIRLVELENSAVLDSNGKGEFCFKINRKKIFVKGTNWVPLDTFHSQDIKRLPKALELLDDIGCNMVRCWGGNVYENDAFYDFCDEHGIMVWQDFAMGCAVYPQERRFFEKIEKEAEFIVKRLRNHPALVLWAGDNEGDICYQGWLGFRKDPNKNVITREVLPRIVEAHDFTRPFLNSSPLVSPECYKNRLDMVENHPWAMRDYFKSEYHRNLKCIFASEIGTFGMPSLSSLKKFISEDKLWPPVYADGTPNEEWLAHSTSPEPYNSEIHQPFVHFVALFEKNVVELFGKKADNIEDFVKQHQIFQAEAFKYFIEKFRIAKWDKTGIIWWNLLNGWPEIDNGVVDYYFVKKLAYYFIKRSQNDICLMIDESDESLRLYGVNDTQHDVSVSYTVRDVLTNEKLLCGDASITADSSCLINSFDILKGYQGFYLIEWEMNGKNFKNHFVSNIKNLDYSKYMSALKTADMYEFTE